MQSTETQRPGAKYPERLEAKQQLPLTYQSLENLMEEHNRRLYVAIRHSLQSRLTGEKTELKLEEVEAIDDASVRDNPAFAYGTSDKNQPLTVGLAQGLLYELRCRALSNIGNLLEEIAAQTKQKEVWESFQRQGEIETKMREKAEGGDPIAQRFINTVDAKK